MGGAIDVKRLHAEMDSAVRDGCFPGGVLLVARGDHVLSNIPAGRLQYNPGSPRVDDNTIYDLASLTKILSTAFLIMILNDKGEIDIEAPLSAFSRDVPPCSIPDDKKNITLKQLLSHASGLPAWRPLYKSLSGLPPEDNRTRALELILSEPLEYRPGEQAVYSDLGFILLGLIMEKVAGKRQDELFRELIASPLNLTQIGYRALDCSSSRVEIIAPTETNQRKTGPPGDPTGHARPGVPVGVVHDDNAQAILGVAGHAGLFADAKSVWKVFNEIRKAFAGKEGQCLARPETVTKFWTLANTAPKSTRALGFDTPAENDSSAGKLFSRNSVGHLGYTGCSLWCDLKRDVTVILLTNRVHPTADNLAIREFRPRIHDAVMESL